MKLKMHEGHAVLQDGKPVYVYDDGKEVAFDAPAAASKISALNAEAKDHRVRAENAEAKLKGFDGIEDPAAARKALQTVKNLDDKKLVDAGEVEKVKSEAIKAVEEKYAPIVKERDTLQGELVTEKIGGSFARSKYITDRLAIPSDLVQSRFGGNFKLEGGKVIAYDHAGNKIYSRAKPGEIAEFDEALETIVDQYPHKAHILKGTGANGGGAPPNGGGNGGGQKSLSRTAFFALSPAEQVKHATSGGTVTET